MTVLPDPSEFNVRNRRGDALPQWGHPGRGADPSDFNVRNAQAAASTGQNLRGQENVWNAGFLNQFRQNYRGALDRNEDVGNWFRQKRDGIALWDDPDAGVAFGDVFYGGRKVENLYSAYGDEFADSVMRPFLMSAQEQARGVSVQSKRAEASENFRQYLEQGDSSDYRYAKQQRAYQDSVDAEKDSWDQDTADTLTVGGGTAGGALTGAGVGAFFGPVGAGVGAFVGGAAGGIGAWLNRDEVQDQVARGRVEARLAEQEGRFAGPATHLASWGGTAMNLLNPVGNVVHGLADTKTFGWGEQGDRKSAFYEMDDEGNLKRGWAWTAADVGGGLASGVGQFASRGGVLAFQAAMTASIAGRGGQLALTGGQSFDVRTGEFDEIYLDEDGNFAPGRLAAGVGVVGIDAVQLGFARGLMNSASNLGRSVTRAEGRAGGAQTQHLGGHVFKVKDGKAVSARASATVMAPSELVNYGNVRLQAMVGRSQQGALTADELYQAAVRISQDSRRVVPALINGFGEGLEEAAQEILEPLSHGYGLDMEDIARSFVYGSAMGVGMTLGSRRGTQSNSQRQYAQHEAIATSLGMEPLSRSAWQAMPGNERAAWLAGHKEVAEVLRPVARELVRQTQQEFVASEPFLEARYKAAADQVAREAQRANEATDVAHHLTQAGNEIEDHMVQMSINTLGQQLELKLDGLQVQLQQAVDSDRPRIEEVIQVSAALAQQVQQARNLFYGADPAEQRRLVDSINQALQQMWDAAREADPSSINAMLGAALPVLRNPVDNQSLQLMLPQLSLEDSLPREQGSSLGLGDDLLRVQLGVTQIMGADFDGDKFSVMTKIMQDENTIRILRTGSQFQSPQTRPGESPVLIANTAFEADIIPVLSESSRQGNSASRVAARDALNQLEQWLEAEYPFLERETNTLILGLKTGDVKAKEKFFTAVLKNHEPQMQETALQHFRNEWFRINSRIRRTLWDFQLQYSAANAKDVSLNIKAHRYNALPATSAVGGARGRQAATATQTLWLRAQGSDIFRKLGALQYSDVRSNEEPVTQDERTMMHELATMYARLSSGQTAPKIEQILGKDEISRNVIRQLEQLALEFSQDTSTKHLAVGLVANLSVPELRTHPDDRSKQVWGKELSLVQQLLRFEVDRAERAMQGTVSPEDAAKFARMRRAAPGEAFLIVFEQYTMRQLLGLDGDVFGGNLTLGQVYAQYVNQDEYHRQRASEVLRSHASYTARSADEGRHNLPIRMPTGADVAITPYQAVVDALLEAGNGVLTYDRSRPVSEQVGGRIGKDSRRRSDQLRSGLSQLWSAMQQQDSRLDRGNAAQVQEFLEMNPEVTASYLGLLSADAISTSIDGDNRTVARWLVEVMQQKTPEKAELMLWWNMKLAEWHALGTNSDDAAGRNFGNIRDRFHLLLYRLAMPENSRLQAELLQRIGTSDSVDSLMAWINDPANGLRYNEAPYTAWHTDLAELDPTYSAGHMTRVLPMAERREAISEFHKMTLDFSRSVQEQRMQDEADELTFRQLQDAVADPSSRSKGGLLYTLQKRLDVARDFRHALGPKAMYQTTLGNLLTILSGTDKGKAATHVAHIGAYDMMRNTPMFGTNEEARLGSATAFSLSDVLRNPQWLNRAMTLMDDDGNLIEWDGLNAERFVELWEEPRNRPLLKAIAFPSALEYVAEEQVDQRYIGDLTLTSLVKNDSFTKQLFGNSPQSRALYLSAISGVNGPSALLKYLGTWTSAQTSALRSSIQTAEQAGKIAEQSMVELAELLQTLAPLANIPNAVAIEVTKPDGSTSRVVPATQLDFVRETAREKLRKATSQQDTAAFKEILMLAHSRMQASFNQMTQAQRDEAETLIETLQDRANVAVVPRVLRAFGLEGVADADWMNASIDIRQRIHDYIRSNPSLLGQARWSKALLRFGRVGVRRSDQLPEMERAEWEELSAVVMTHAVQQAVATTVPGQELLPLKGGTMADLRYFDPSYEFLLDDLMTPSSPLIQAAQRLHTAFNKDGVIVPDPTRIAQVLDRTLLKEDRYGPLTDAVVANILQSHMRVDASGPAQGISAGGSIPKNKVAAMVATRRTFEIPDDSLLSTAQFTYDDLLNSTTFTVSRPGGRTGSETMQLLDGRFVKEFRIIVGGQVVDDTGHRLAFTDPKRFGVSYIGDTAALQSGLVMVNRRRLQQFLELQADRMGLSTKDIRMEMTFYHPDDQPQHMANNLFFEGALADGDTDNRSLLAAWWLSMGGPDSGASTRALSSPKKGLPSLIPPALMDRDASRALMAGWEQDMGTAIRRLASGVMADGSLGGGETINPAMFNAVVKQLKMQFLVRETLSDGTIEIATVDEMIASQQPGGIPLEGQLELVPLSDAQLATLLGDSQAGLNTRVSLQELDLDSTNFEQYMGDYDDASLNRLEGLLNPTQATPFSGRYTGRILQRQLLPFTFMDDAQISRHSDGRTYEAQLEVEIRQQRMLELSKTQRREATQRAVEVVRQMVNERGAEEALASFGFPFRTFDTDLDKFVTKLAMGNYEDVVENSEGTMLRVYHHDVSARDRHVSDLYGPGSLERKGKVSAFWVAPHDPVVVMLDEFAVDDTAGLQQVLERLSGFGADIILQSDAGRGQLHTFGQQFLRDSHYDTVRGTRNMFIRTELDQAPVTLAATYAQLTETGPVPMQDINTVLQLQTNWIEENTGIILNPAFGQRKALRANDMPIAGHVGHGVLSPRHSDRIRNRILNALPDLLTLNRELDTSGKSRQELDSELTRAVQKMHQQLGADGLYPPGTRFQLGDIIPLYDETHDTIVLYRHGFKPPKMTDQMEMLDEAGVLLYSPELDAQHTADEGDVLRFEPASQWGMRVILRVPLQELGAKLQFEGTGFKALLRPATEGQQFPELFDGIPMDLLVSSSDSVSKNNYAGRVDNFQNAFTYLGIDFRPDLAKFFFGNTSADSISKVELLLNTMRTDLPKFDVMTIDRMMKQNSVDAAIVGWLAALPAGQAGFSGSELLSNLRAPDLSPEAQITLATMTYLMYERAKVTDILSAPGMAAPNAMQSGRGSWRMPGLFTQAFENGTPELRKHIFGKLNERFPNRGVASDGRRLGYALTEDFRVMVSTEDARYSGELGWLQFVPLHSATQNPVFNALSAQRADSQIASAQQANVITSTLGARFAIGKLDGKKSTKVVPPEVLEIREERDLYGLLRDVKEPKHLKLDHDFTKAEIQYMLDGRDLVASLRQPLDMDGWSEKDRTEYREARRQVAYDLGFDEVDATIVDTFVRMHAGKTTLTKKQMREMTPQQVEELTAEINPRFEVAMNNLAVVAENIEKRLLPTTDAAIPWMHVLDLAALFRAHQENGRFQLKTMVDDQNSTTSSWMDWVHVQLAVADTENALFDPVFLPYVDAMMHSYMDSGLLFTGVPVSMNADRAEMLAKTTSDQLMSLDPRRAEALSEAEIFVEGARSEDLFGGFHEGVTFYGTQAPESAVAERQRRIARWRHNTGQHSAPAGSTIKDLRQHGQRIVDRVNTQSALLRIGTNIRVANALANPILMMSTPLEMAIQRFTERGANLLTGDATRLGLVGSALDAAIRASTDGEYGVSAYTADQRKTFAQAAEAIGHNAKFRNMVYSEFKPRIEYNNAGAIERWTGKVAEFFGKTQDIYYGMRATPVAKRYLDVVFREVRNLGDRTNLTPERVIMEMQTDPTWVEQNHPGLHMTAMNSLRGIKNMKATTISLAWRGLLKPLTHSSSFLTQFLSTTHLQWPAQFATYGSNVAIRFLGLQGLEALTAAWFTGRAKGPINRVLNAPLRALSRNQEVINEQDQVYDMSETIESLDISHAVLKSGVSMTSLFAFGLMAGSLGLTGEDDEDRRLRKIAEMQGVPYMYDPRDIANDFRNADMLYLDNIPLLSDVFRVTTDQDDLDGRSMASMNFVLKQVMSPILGMQRFIDNGNPYELLWGFEDAIGSLPLINTMGWDDAVHTYAELMAKADQEMQQGDAASMPAAYRYMVSAFFTLERMMLENSFANMIYVGMDEWDRDPWKIPDRNATGQVITDRFGNPSATMALQQFEDPETGEIRSGYVNRDPWDAMIYSYAENRGSMAWLSELVTLGRADMLRSDQPIKTRKLPLMQLSMEEADGIVRAMWKGGARPEQLNIEGVYLTVEQRKELSSNLQAEIIADGLALGLDERQAKERFFAIWDGKDISYGTQDALVDQLVEASGMSEEAAKASVLEMWGTQYGAPRLGDMVWSRGDYENGIGYTQSAQYAQKNTTYIKGPDGRFWATGVSRDLFQSMFGMNPLQKFMTSGDIGQPQDGRLNTTDPVNNLNTGMRGVVRIDESWDAPDDPRPGRGEDEGLDTSEGKAASSGSGWQDFGNRGSGWRNFGRSGWRNFGRRGGGGGSGSFTRLNTPERGQVPYSNTIQNINVGGAFIRRANLRRERIDSDRGRLKPWQ